MFVPAKLASRLYGACEFPFGLGSGDRAALARIEEVGRMAPHHASRDSGLPYAGSNTALEILRNNWENSDWASALTRGGEMGARIRAFDWSSTPLGPVQGWPPARRENELRAEARQAQEQAVAILESITDGFLALDRDWRFTYVNAEAERISGIRREDQIGKSQWELFPATLGTFLESEWRRAVAEQVPVQFEHYYEPWKQWFHIRAYPSRDGGLSVFFQDITARKQCEVAQQQAHDELERRVEERTQALSRANARLAQQIARRQRVEEARSELRRRLVRAQEEEHRRIARELHDDLTQRLAVLAIDIGKLEQVSCAVEDVAAKAGRLREQLVALSESVHSLSRQLHPSILDDLGLVDALRLECISLGQRDRISVRFHAQDVPMDLPRDVALCFYRVAQEALRNIAHHAQCSQASVRLAADARELLLCVRDRGVGFDLSVMGKTGLGLESLRERAHLVHAGLTIRSRIGAGTRITLRAPLRRSQP